MKILKCVKKLNSKLNTKTSYGFSLGLNLDPTDFDDIIYLPDITQMIKYITNELEHFRIDISIAVYSVMVILSKMYVHPTASLRIYRKVAGERDPISNKVSYTMEETNDSAIKENHKLAGGFKVSYPIPPEKADAPMGTMIRHYSPTQFIDVNGDRNSARNLYRIKEIIEECEDKHYPIVGDAEHGRGELSLREWNRVFTEVHLKNTTKNSDSTGVIDIVALFRSSDIGYNVNKIVLEPYGPMDTCRVYDEFNPRTGIFNQFSGFHPDVYHPKRVAADSPHDWSNDRQVMYILFHIYVIWCDGDMRLTQKVLTWIAASIFRPNMKLSCMLVIYGQQGVGKTTIMGALSKMFGSANTVFINTMDYLIGNFNSLLTGKSLVIVDEVKGAVLKTEPAKAIITKDTLLSTKKGVDGEDAPFKANIIGCTNDRMIESNERRIQIVPCSTVALYSSNSRTYFTDLVAAVADYNVGTLTRLLFRMPVREFADGAETISNANTAIYYAESKIHNEISDVKRVGGHDAAHYVLKFLIFCIVDGGLIYDENGKRWTGIRVPLVIQRFEEWYASTFPNTRLVGGDTLQPTEENSHFKLCKDLVARGHLMSEIVRTGGFTVVGSASGNTTGFGLTNKCKIRYVTQFLKKHINLFTVAQIRTIREEYGAGDSLAARDLVVELDRLTTARINSAVPPNLSQIDVTVTAIVKALHTRFIREDDDGILKFRGWEDDDSPILENDLPLPLVLNHTELNK